MFAAATSFAQTSTYVSGYSKSNGTYVQGYYRTTPNSTRNDNYSTIGNVNPYTGKSGTQPRDEDYSATSSYSTGTYSAPSPVSTYSAPSYSTSIYDAPSYSSSATIYTGSRGGTYYVNSNGNKTYINN